MNYTIPHIANLYGFRTVPGDKSISHRALMIGAISSGLTEINSCSRAADPLSTFACIRQLGLHVEDSGNTIHIHGKGRLELHEPTDPLDAGNSGTTLRLLSGILVGQIFPSLMIGDSSLCKRPMKRIIDPLRLMGANIQGTETNTAPLKITPVKTLHAIDYKLPIPSAQIKSAILFAGLYADGVTSVLEQMKTRDHTERMLGLDSVIKDGMYCVKINSKMKIEGKKFFVPGDISAAAFFISAGLIIPESEIRIHNVGLNPTRKRILDFLIQMGGNIEIEDERVIEGEPIGNLVVKYSELRNNLELTSTDVVDLIDEIPVLSVTALFAEGTFQVRHAKELRAKETDRISAIVNNMRILGADIEEYEDGFAFEGKQNLHGGVVLSYGDHRIAMAFGIAGLRIKDLTIHNSDCVDISFPGFWGELLTNK